MKLSSIRLSPYDGINFLGEPQNDDNQLVAYRVRFSHSGNKVTYNWMVFYKGIHFANISKQDSRWVHDNWTKKYVSADIFQKVDRAFLDARLTDLVYLIRRAISEKRADTVVLPIEQEQEQNAYRVWSIGANVSIQAQYVGLVGNKVKLRKKDGREIEIPFDLLSDKDQAEIMECYKFTRYRLVV